MTTNLGESTGVQHAGLKDGTSTATVQGLAHALIIGTFKRGRTDQPMRINRENIRARLGYEPNNPFYQIVQDCLDLFTSVWVLRVTAHDQVEQISCDGATDAFSIEWSYSKEDFTVPLESELRLFNGSSGSPAPFGFEYLGTDQDVEPPYDYKDNYRVSEGFRFELKLLPENQDQYFIKFSGNNPTIVQLGPNHWGVCLAPAASCEPSEPVEFSATWNQLVSHKRLTFSINGSPPSIFTGLAEVGDDDADTNFEDYFSRFAAVNRVGDDYPIISTTGSNQCAFRVGFDNESGQTIISARDDSYNPLSTTLELIATDHPDDFATHYFGGSVTLHACGISEPA